MANKKESKNSNKQENKQNMNIINKLLENVSGIRTLPRRDIGDQIPVSKKGDTLSDILNNDINVSSVLSILKNNKAKAIRFTTLEAICRALDCQPGDIL